MNFSTQRSSSRLRLALLLAFCTAVYALLYRFVPYQVQAFLPFPLGALALFVGARLNWWQAPAVVFLIMAVSDLGLYALHGWPASWSTYICFGLYIALGLLLRNSQSSWLIAWNTLVGFALFFLLTNAWAWYDLSLPEYKPRSWQTLLLAYGKGLEFELTRPGRLLGELSCSFGLFGLHAYLVERFGLSAEVAQAENIS